MMTIIYIVWYSIGAGIALGFVRYYIKEIDFTLPEVDVPMVCGFTIMLWPLVLILIIIKIISDKVMRHIDNREKLNIQENDINYNNRHN